MIHTSTTFCQDEREGETCSSLYNFLFGTLIFRAVDHFELRNLRADWMTALKIIHIPVSVNER